VPIEDVTRELGLIKPEQIIKLAFKREPHILLPSGRAMQEALLNAHYYPDGEATICARYRGRDFGSRWIMSCLEMDRTKSSSSWDRFSGAGRQHYRRGSRVRYLQADGTAFRSKGDRSSRSGIDC